MMLNISDVNWAYLTATRTLVSLISSSSQQQHIYIIHLKPSLPKYTWSHCTQQLNGICMCGYCIWITKQCEIKADLNNIWQKCSWQNLQNLQQNYVEQTSDFFPLSNATFSFKMRFIFFVLQQRNIETSRFKMLSWLQLLFPNLASQYLHDRSLLMSMSWRNIIFNFFSNLFNT